MSAGRERGWYHKPQRRPPGQVSQVRLCAEWGKRTGTTGLLSDAPTVPYDHAPVPDLTLVTQVAPDAILDLRPTRQRPRRATA